MTRTERRTLIVVLILAIGIRVAILAAASAAHDGTEIFKTPDSPRYLTLAESLAETGTYRKDGQPELFRPPGYPLFVAIGHALGHPIAVTLALQAGLGAIGAWCCFLAGRDAGGTALGIRAAAFYAVEPGQWAWSALIMSETLATVFVAASLAASVRYLKEGRASALLLGVAAAIAMAYVRTAGYLLPLVLAMALIVLARPTVPARSRWRHLAAAAIVTFVGLGAWHVRNGIQAGFWGFSTQFDRAIYFVGAGTVTSRAENMPYNSARGALAAELGVTPESDTDAATAATMRSRGFAAILSNPVSFAAGYLGGTVATMAHPGTGAFMRLFEPGRYDSGESVSGLVLMGRWNDATQAAVQKGAVYWIVTVLLVAANIFYLTRAAGGAWRGRALAWVRLAVLVVLYFLALSGGPQGDSRRRAPMMPAICLLAATLPLRSRRADSASPIRETSQNLRRTNTV